MSDWLWALEPESPGSIRSRAHLITTPANAGSLCESDISWPLYVWTGCCMRLQHWLSPVEWVGTDGRDLPVAWDAVHCGLFLVRPTLPAKP
jgi:hypothetical protein